MTPSAGRGILEAVFWKPAIQWRIERILVLKDIRFTSFRRNEVNTKAASPTAASGNGDWSIPLYFANEDRAQRNTLALRDVDYIIEARFRLTPRASAAENVTKFLHIFNRRLRTGQHFHQPYFGCREFPADVMPAEGPYAPIGEDRDLGLMLWDIDFQDGCNRPLFFEARLLRGIVHVPEHPSTGGTP